MLHKHQALLFCVASGLCLSPALAAEMEFSGFLDDYSGAVRQPDGAYIIQPDNIAQALAGYEAIMVDQPEILIAPDSKYRGMKPDDMKLISDALRQVVLQQLERGKMRVVGTPGPKTLYLRLGLTDVHVKKKGKNILNFTPVGLVVGAASSPFKDVMDKIVLQEANIEAEMLDSQTTEQIGAIVKHRGAAEKKKEYTSWEDVQADLEILGSRLACRLDHAGSPEAQQACMDEYQLATD